VGLIDGTARLNKGGNTGLSSHRDGYFRVLKDIEKGDAIVVDSPRGEMTYRVRETFVLDKMDDSVLDPTPEPTVTLVTCYPFYFVGHAPKRFIVRAVLEENPEAPQSTDLAQSAPTAVAEN
jgi:LPXTG-site transpeptidase (sortase) family protein